MANQVKTPKVTVIDPTAPEKAKLRVAAYARVSSDSADQLNSYLAQVDYYTRHIGENPDWELADIYADEGISGLDISLGDEVMAELVDGRLRELAQSPHLLTAPEPKQVKLDMDAIRLQNELTLALNRGSEKPEYIKSLALAVTAQRYGQLPDPTPAHELERLRARLEQGPADADALAGLLRTAVRAVRITPNKNVELELTNGTIITEKEVQSA